MAIRKMTLFRREAAEILQIAPSKNGFRAWLWGGVAIFFGHWCVNLLLCTGSDPFQPFPLLHLTRVPLALICLALAAGCITFWYLMERQYGAPK
jgi:hypothetical protein